MRLWSLHPKYLDARGLVALWREGLLARAVLEGRTRGYRRHPQLLRFREHPDPLGAIDAYLQVVFEEASRRKYTFDSSKVNRSVRAKPIPVTNGQLDYEWRHLLEKLKTRAPSLYHRLRRLEEIDPHPLMKLVPGPIASWEVVKSRLK